MSDRQPWCLASTSVFRVCILWSGRRCSASIFDGLIVLLSWCGVGRLTCFTGRVDGLFRANRLTMFSVALSATFVALFWIVLFSQACKTSFIPFQDCLSRAHVSYLWTRGRKMYFWAVNTCWRWQWWCRIHWKGTSSRNFWKLRSFRLRVTWHGLDLLANLSRFDFVLNHVKNGFDIPNIFGGVLGDVYSDFRGKFGHDDRNQ